MDENDCIHRKAKYGHALCGKTVSNQKTTINDRDVTCPDCERILQEVTQAMMKTKIIHKYVDHPKTPLD